MGLTLLEKDTEYSCYLDARHVRKRDNSAEDRSVISVTAIRKLTCMNLISHLL